MLKYKILNKNTDSFIDIPLNLNFDPMDNSEIVEEIIRQEKRKSINIQEDLEIFRYKPVFNGQPFIPKFDFFFFNCDTGFHTKNYMNIGFNITNNILDDDRLKKGFSKSFYVLDFYDSMDTRIQNKISSIILPIVPSKVVDKLSLIPTISLNPDSDGYHIYYLKNIDFPKDIFMKLTFFNAKTGKRISFFNVFKLDFFISQGELPTKEEYNDEMLYFPYRLENNYIYDMIDVPINNAKEKYTAAIEIKFKPS